MEIKYKKPLIIASIIDMGLGAFLFICGMLEFAGILQTPANNSIETLGVQLSYLVFISGILVFISGTFSFIDRRSFKYINLEILAGLIALAFPIFISIVLLLQIVICIRLVPTMLASLFYIIAVLIVKLSNDAMQKTHKIDTGKLQVGERRKQGVDVTSVFKRGNKAKAKTANISSSLRGMAASSKKRVDPVASLKRALNGSGRKSRHGGGFKGLYSGSRKRSRLRIGKRK